MGREVKRVPVDFDWPLNKVWQGNLMPDRLDELPCPAGDACEHGATTALAWVGEIAHLALMVDDDLRAQAMGRPMHPYFDSVPGHGRPSPEIAEFGAGLAGRSGSPFGHDAIDRWSATDKLIEAAGLPKDWGTCPQCNGHGSVEAYEGQRAEAEAWQRTEPPNGDGWQVWETVSEGSPISPVFPTREGLIEWLCSPAYTWGASSPLTREQADAFVDSAWAPSFIGVAGHAPVPGEQVNRRG